jgi:glycosyltransferase involved in cell wall biosynthesis
MDYKISIITASYNYAQYIGKTIESVQSQSFSDWEMIIVDDGSVDNSVNVIREYCSKDKRIKLYQNDVNKGLIETVKLGIEKASGDWIIFLESDDTIEPNYIEEKIKIIEKYPDIKFIFNDINLFGDEKRVEKYKRGYFKNFYKTLNKLTFPTKIVKELKNRNVVPTFSCVMLKKEILQDIKFPDIQAKCADYYLWTQLASKYEFYYLPKKLTNWRMSKESYINKKEEDFWHSRYFYKVLLRDNLSDGRHKLWHRISFIFSTIIAILFRYNKD